MSTAPTPKDKAPSKKDLEIAARVAKILAPEVKKAVDNQVAPILAEIASIKKDLIAEIKAMQQSAPAPTTAPAAPAAGLQGKIKIGDQEIDLSNIAGEIKKVLPNITDAQLTQLQQAATGATPNAGAGAQASTPAPATPLSITLPNGQQQQVNLAGLQQLMQMLQMFGVMPSQQQSGNGAAAAWLQEATYRNMLDDMAFGSQLKRALIARAAKGLDIDLSASYANINDALVQQPLNQIAAAAKQGATQNANPTS